MTTRLENMIELAVDRMTNAETQRLGEKVVQCPDCDVVSNESSMIRHRHSWHRYEPTTAEVEFVLRQEARR